MASKLDILKSRITTSRGMIAALGAIAAAGVATSVVWSGMDRVPSMRKWWIEPILLGLGGVVVAKWSPAIGYGLVGAAGYCLAQNSGMVNYVRGFAAQSFGASGADAGALSHQDRYAAIIGQNIGRELGRGDAGALVERRRDAYAGPDAGAFIQPRGDAAAFIDRRRSDVGLL